MNETTGIEKTTSERTVGVEGTVSRGKDAAVFESGAWVGRKQAFAELAGRCSAATAECLRQTRDRKSYRALRMTWDEFCRERMGISRVTAEKIIGRLEEFGPQYFILAQATGITPTRGGAPAASPLRWSMASWECSGSAMSKWGLSRVLRDEASREAGRGKSARPV